MTCNFSEVCNVPEFVKDSATIDAIAYECLRFKTLMPTPKVDKETVLKETVLLRQMFIDEHRARKLEVGHIELIKQYTGYKLLSRATSQWYRAENPDECFLSIYVEKNDYFDPDEEKYGELLVLDKYLEQQNTTTSISGMWRGLSVDISRRPMRNIVSRYFIHQLYHAVALSYKRQYDSITEKLIANSCL